MAAYTKCYNAQVLDVVTECTVYPPFVMQDVATRKDLPKGFVATAMWDTGAEVTLLHPRVVKALALERESQVLLSGIGGETVEENYVVHILLPTGNLAFGVEATATENVGEYDVIIGMDIISNGDFAFTNKDGKSQFSFRFPTEGHVDFETL